MEVPKSVQLFNKKILPFWVFMYSALQQQPPILETCAARAAVDFAIGGSCCQIQPV